LIKSSSLPLRRYFCLADGSTAALISDRGTCDFLCAPAFDSPLALAALLDQMNGGCVGVEPDSPGEPVASWSQHSREIVLEWPVGVRIRCGLLPDGSGHSAVVWLAEGPPGVPIRVLARGPGPGHQPGWRAEPFGLALAQAGHPDGPGGPLALVVSGEAEVTSDGLTMTLGPGGQVFCLGVPDEAGRLPPRLEQAAQGGAVAVAALGWRMDESNSQDRTWVSALLAGHQLAGVANSAPAYATEAVVRSLLTLRGLQDVASGLMVASPLTSVPQWPGGERSWDYRYAWLRDCADGGMALARAGAFEEASKLALGLAGRLQADPGRIDPVRRLDGGPVPTEHLLEHLSGYEGALVRIGNAAAGQAQVDTLGELVRFAESLDQLCGCPKPLLDLVPQLAELARTNWDLPDHGIWEVRGAKRHYVHSKLLAWSALCGAIRLAGEGHITGSNSPAWAEARSALEDAIATHGTGPDGQLIMAFNDPSADSSTLAAYVVGYPREGAGDAATLDYVLTNLEDGFLLARHHPERDGIPGPCAPFIFPSLWAVIAEAKLGRRESAQARLQDVLRMAGPAGQLSEVAEPNSLKMLGNYPQVQSHAALVEAVLQLWGPAPEP
jgi:hypothetical protein